MSDHIVVSTMSKKQITKEAYYALYLMVTKELNSGAAIPESYKYSKTDEENIAKELKGMASSFLEKSR
jgi:hypothetical protein